MTEVDIGVMQLQAKKLQGCRPLPEQGRSKEGVYPESQRELGPADALTSDFYPPELWENTFLLSHPVWGTLLRQPLGKNTKLKHSFACLKMP